MSRSLGIALLNPIYWPEVRRGSERLIGELAGGLIRAGHRPRLIVGHRGLPKTNTEAGLGVVRVPRMGNRLTSRLGYHERLSHVPLQYTALSRGADDLVHAFYVSDANGAVRWSRRTGRPSVFSVMGVVSPDTVRAKRGRQWLWRRALDGSAAVVALSDAAAGPLRSLGVDPVVIHPGVDLSAFRQTVDRSSSPTVLSPADPADPRKRIAMLVEAHAILRETTPDARLILSRPRDPAVAARFGGDEGIEFADLDDRDRLVEAYSRAWVTALPATEEAFGLVLAESLACGTPAVGTRDGGIPEVLGEEGVGVLHEGGAPELAAAIASGLEIATNPEARSRCRARAERFSIEHCVQSHLQLYERLLGAR